MRFIPTSLLLLSFFFYSLLVSAQITIQGKILDQKDNQPLPGVNLAITHDSQTFGTISDIEGNFELEVELSPPFTLNFSLLGYATKEMVIREQEQYMEVFMSSESNPVRQVGVSTTNAELEVNAASKAIERKLESPVSIEKMTLLDIRELPTRDFYAGAGYLKGALINSSSYGYQSLNTRAFGNLQNWRFIQLIDGMDISGPGVNYGVGSVMKGSELDIRSMEVVPGPGSALYGPNAFNGLLSMETKNPFSYQGVSAYIKQGVTNRPNDDGSFPVTDVGIRFAKAFGNKFAFKLNATYLSANDWLANDPAYLITNETIPFMDQLLQTPIGDPNYNAVNVYGDESQAMVNIGDSMFVPINRSGIAEEDIIDFNINNIFLQGSLHYLINDRTELTYDIRYSNADNIIRYENFYPFENFQTIFQKLELKGDNFFTRLYFANDNSGDGYSMLNAGAIVQEFLKPTPLWGEEYGAAFRGEVQGVSGGDHAAARIYADRDIPGPDSEAFQQARAQTIGIPIDEPGGSGVVMKASFAHFDANYQFNELISFMDLQVGGNYRRYSLNSEGHVYSDGPLGFGKPIPTHEYGVYVQGTRKFFDDHLQLKGSLRYDKNKNFQGRISPRLSGVFSWGEDSRHTLRINGQTGFRNPANQDTYVAFNAGPLIYLGNIEDNISNFNIRGANGEVFSGQEIYDNLVTTQSLTAFAQTGDPSVLQPVNMEFLQQEEITTYEFGYRGNFGGNLNLEATLHHNRYQNFTANIVSFSPQLNIPILTLNNVPDLVTSTGLNLGMGYAAESGLRFGASYNYVTFDADEATTANPNYFPDFNAPNNIFKAYIGYRPEQSNLGFNLRARWIDGFSFQSPNGQGMLDAYSSWDGAILYRLPTLRSILKLGGTNLFNNGYKTVYGGPMIGRELYLQWTFDELWK